MTLGTMKHKGQVCPADRDEVESIFDVLNLDLLTPPEIEGEFFRKSLSWFKKESEKFETYTAQMIRASQVLQNLGFEILVLHASQLSEVLYEDSCQALASAGTDQFEIVPLNR